MKRITIKDIAKMLNISTSTVSRALSDHPDISDKTKSRVKAVADEFNYTTNVHARFFRKQHSGLIALILPELNMFFTPSLIKGINKTIDASNFSLITFISNDSFAKEKEIIKQCMSWAVEGILISLSKETNNLSHLESVKKAEIECVLLDRTLENNFFPAVTIDSAEASFKAISTLIEKGRKNILGIFADPKLKTTQERLLGYKKALRENNIPILNENIISVEKSSDLDFILPTVFNYNKKLNAIFTMTDELLARSLYHINSIGLSIPSDISVITISDGVYPHLTYPKITHIKDSGAKMGKSACSFLLDAISNKSANIKSGLIVSTKLVELDSI